MALKDFMGYMKNREEIADAQEVLSKSDDSNKRNKASQYLTEQGLSLVDPILVAGLTDEQKREYGAKGLEIKGVKLLEDVGNTLSGKGLEGMLQEIGGKPLEEMAVAAGEQLARGKVKGYDEVISAGQRFYGLQDIAKRYDGGKGKIDPKEELPLVYEGVADSVVDEIKTKLKGKYSKDTTDAILSFTRAIIAGGGVKDTALLTKGIKRSVANAEKALREVESKTKKRLSQYAVDSIVALRKGSPEDTAIATSLLYSAGKRSEELRKEAEKEALKRKAA